MHPKPLTPRCDTGHHGKRIEPGPGRRMFDDLMPIGFYDHRGILKGDHTFKLSLEAGSTLAEGSIGIF